MINPGTINTIKRRVYFNLLSLKEFVKDYENGWEDYENHFEILQNLNYNIHGLGFKGYDVSKVERRVMIFEKKIMIQRQWELKNPTLGSGLWEIENRAREA